MPPDRAVTKPNTAPDHAAGRLTEDQVVAYLRRHPEFLERHPDLLDVLHPPARQLDGKNIADLQQAMIHRLRDRIDGVENDRLDLISTTRGNLSSQTRVHETVLDLIDARSFEQFIEILTSDLVVKLHLDVVALCVENDRPDLPRTRAGIRFLPPGYVASVLGPTETVLLRAIAEPEPRIYGQGAGLVASEALLRIEVGPDTPTGLLALGARTPGHFAPGQGTELLGFLAGVIESTARAWLDLPR